MDRQLSLIYFEDDKRSETIYHKVRLNDDGEWVPRCGAAWLQEKKDAYDGLVQVEGEENVPDPKEKCGTCFHD